MRLRILFISALLFLAVETEAATLYMDPSSATLNRGDTITISVRIDTDEAANECINAIDGVVTYSESIQPIDVSIGESIFSIWVEEPVINQEDNTITFAGGIPNGYCGRIQGDPRLTNNIVKLVFRSPGLMVGGGEERKAASVSFTEETTAYLNDGAGTKAKLRTFGTQLTLNDRAGSARDPWLSAVNEDNRPPQQFSIFLERDETAFGRKWFIVFNTTDKETGIDHYEVMEEPLSDLPRFDWGRSDAPWIKARSPYVLQDQTLNSTIRVRAIDKAGNEYIATLVPDEELRTPVKGQYLPYLLLGVAALAALLAIGAVLFALRRRRARSAADPNVSHGNESE